MQKVIDKINNSKSVAILAHINEDADALGSSYAMARVLRSLGKEAVCYVSEPDGHLGFLNPEYTVYEEGMEKKHDLCIGLDCGDEYRFGDRIKIFEAAEVTVNIDHHKTNTYFADENYVDDKASATGEILFEMFKTAGWDYDGITAQFLYAAICSDTGCFKYSNVTPKTLRIIADLLEYKFDHAETVRLLFDTFSMESTRFKGFVMQNVKSYADGKISLVAICDEWITKSGLTAEEVPNIVDIPRCVEGTEIAIALKKKTDEIRINLRSNGDADVAAVALRFGGGGHAKAAGCGIKGATMEEAEKIIVEACAEVLG